MSSIQERGVQEPEMFIVINPRESSSRIRELIDQYEHAEELASSVAGTMKLFDLINSFARIAEQARESRIFYTSLEGGLCNNSLVLYANIEEQPTKGGNAPISRLLAEGHEFRLDANRTQQTIELLTQVNEDAKRREINQRLTNGKPIWFKAAAILLPESPLT